MTATREALGKLFRVSRNRMAAIEPKSAVFPSNDAPVVRRVDDGERELVELSWGFVLPQKGLAPKRVTNVRDDKVRSSSFWKGSFNERRCLIPVTSFSEPKGRSPATWHWFALKGDEERPLFAFAGIWRSFHGPIQKDGEAVDIDAFSFMTTRPNKLVATVHSSRMPVILATPEAHDVWLNGTQEKTIKLIESYPADQMEIVQAGSDRKDLG